jgi:hypothetical protein
MERRLAAHAKDHSAEHIQRMKADIQAGMTFKRAHTRALVHGRDTVQTFQLLCKFCRSSYSRMSQIQTLQLMNLSMPRYRGRGRWRSWMGHGRSRNRS